MATKFYCDVCEKEHGTKVELSEITITPNANEVAAKSFDICPKCSNKMFKPVTAYHFMIRITIPNKGENNG